MSALQVAVTIADRFIDPKNPASVHNEGRLGGFVSNTAVAFAFIALFIFYMGAVEKNRRHIVMHEVNLAFEFTCPPPEPPMVRARDTLVPMSFSEGSRPAALSNVDNPIRATKLASRPADTPRTAEQNKIVVPEPPIAVVAPLRAPPEASPAFSGSPDAAMAATPVPASVGSGALDGTKGASGAGGTGTGIGNGDKNSLAGADFGATNSLALKTGPVAMGNIKPYTRAIMSQIQKAWKPGISFDKVIVTVDLSHDGKVLDGQISQGCGNEDVDQDLIKTIRGMDFSPLPDWYHGTHLRIKLVLDSFN